MSFNFIFKWLTFLRFLGGWFLVVSPKDVFAQLFQTIDEISWEKKILNLA
jgi:hypothetical protein